MVTDYLRDAEIRTIQAGYPGIRNASATLYK